MFMVAPPGLLRVRRIWPYIVQPEAALLALCVDGALWIFDGAQFRGGRIGLCGIPA